MFACCTCQVQHSYLSKVIGKSEKETFLFICLYCISLFIVTVTLLLNYLKQFALLLLQEKINAA